MARRIRIVVGEGRTAQRGLLRFVLEGEGFDVIGEATGSADLSGVIQEKRPDVVVLDDGIGVMAVSMVHEVAPDTKIVLVWPAAVVPIGGDARVEPAKILKDLGPAVEHVAAATVGLFETFQRPEWIDRVRKDPATLREKLGNGKESTTRPSVTRLQKGSRRLHPTGRRSKATGQERREEIVPAPVVVLPSGDGGGELEPVLDIGGAGAAPVEEAVPGRSEWNRRLGTLALSGAAAVSALALALALGGGRIPASVVRGGGTLPPGAGGFFRPGPTFDDPSGGGSLGGSGYDPIPVPEQPPVGTDRGGIGRVDGGLGGDLATPGTGGSDEPPTVVGPGDGGPAGNGGGGGGGNGGGGTGGGGGGNGGGNGGGGGGGGGGNGGGGGGSSKGTDGLPGKSAEHNPHGGPPSKLGQTPAHGQGLGAVANHSKPKHTHKH